LYVSLHTVTGHLFPSLPIPKAIFTMSSSAHFPDSQSFQQQSNEFVSWLEANPGVKVNPKIFLADLRSTGAGRGVGKLTPLPTTHISAGWSVQRKRTKENAFLTVFLWNNSCTIQHFRGRRAFLNPTYPHPRCPKLSAEDPAPSGC
jgi:hypothetical protein